MNRYKTCRYIVTERAGTGQAVNKRLVNERTNEIAKPIFFRN